MSSIPAPLSQFLMSNSRVQFIHHHWVDLSGILRERVIPKRFCLDLVSKNETLRLSPFSLLSAVDLPQLPRNHLPGGWTHLVPQWNSIRMLCKDHASVMCSIAPEAIDPVKQSFGAFFTNCPRSTLQDVISTANARHGVSFLVGFELEFYLIDESEKMTSSSHSGQSTPLDEYGWSAAAPGDTRYTTCLENCALALEKAGIVVQQYHSEAGPHQCEISTGPLPILDAIDTVIQAQQIIRITASYSHLRATFQPRPFSGLPTSGLHAHLSIESASRGPAMERSMHDAFLAGILHRLPLLCFFGMPSPNSYYRVGSLCTGEKIGWGTGNRDMPIRKIKDGHWEIRVIDAIANLYLTLAGFVGAGLLGIEEGEKLRWKDCRDFTSRLSEEDSIGIGLVTDMPKSLDESKALFDTSRMGLNALLGADLLDLYAHVKRLEIENFKNGTGESQDLMYRKYV